MGAVGVGMQPPRGLAATTLILVTAHITTNVALRVEPTTEEFPLLMPRVRPHQAESYLCTPIRVDTDVPYSITGFRPNATKMTAHHMLIYGCEEPGAESPTWNCGEMAVKEPGMGSAQPCAKGSQIIYAWAMDAESLELPKGVGFRVGRDSAVKYLVLQVLHHHHMTFFRHHHCHHCHHHHHNYHHNIDERGSHVEDYDHDDEDCGWVVRTKKS